MEIQLATEVTEPLLRAMERLIPQLNPAAIPPTHDQLEALITSDSTQLYLAFDGEDRFEIVGILTVAWYRIPSGLRVWIEDVVVDERVRGRGIGEALVRVGLERARELGARSVDLTSRAEREAANRLYQRVGFQRRETNAYRYFFAR